VATQVEGENPGGNNRFSKKTKRSETEGCAVSLKSILRGGNLKGTRARHDISSHAKREKKI